ncbi:MAG: PAS domain-containing protein [Candidatus Saliniplasma sp.]
MIDMEEFEDVVIEFVRQDAPILLIVIDRDGNITDVNEYALKRLGDDIIGQDLKKIFLDFDNSMNLSRLSKDSTKNKLFNLDTPSELPETYYLSFFQLDDGIIVLGKPDVEKLENLSKKMVELNNEFATLTRDIQKKNIQLLKTEKALDSSLNGVAICNTRGKVTYVNPALLDIWGYEKKEVLGNDLEYLFDNSRELDSFIKGIKEEGSGKKEIKATRKGGSEIIVETSAAVIESDNGGSEGIVFTFMDITEKKKMEERKDILNSLLRHDIKNKAQIVQGYLQLLEDDVQISEEGKKFVEKALAGNRESVNLINKIRMLIKAQEGELETVDLRTSLEESFERVDDMAEDNEILVEVADIETPCKVRAGSLLKEVFSNIIENSIYHSGGSRIKIWSENDDEYCVCIIEDDGVGIQDDKKEEVFKKGFTTGKNRGTGLGLYLVKMLVESYGGSVEVKDSELGGARFDVRLKRE